MISIEESEERGIMRPHVWDWKTGRDSSETRWNATIERVFAVEDLVSRGYIYFHQRFS